MKKAQLFYYSLLFAIAIFSLSLFLFSIFSDTNYDILSWYSKLYLILLLCYTWYTFILLFINDLKKINYPRYRNEKISVIIPVFNENLYLLKNAIGSVAMAKGNKEIILIDDGSTNQPSQYLDEITKEFGIKTHYFSKNRGKRHALHHAITNLLGDTRYIVTIDSDTILDENALIRIVEPLKMPEYGASTGDVRLLNEQKNWLTKMQGAYYWVGLNIYKKAQSSLGMVVCCSGCIAAYKKEIIVSIIDEFVNQEFFGEACTHSEDRHLTNLVLKNGYKVVYVPEAISHTEAPTTLNEFLKQQQRWKRGYIRESIYTLTYAWRVKPILFIEILFWNLTVPFFVLGLMMALFVSILLEPSFFFITILPSWLSFILIRYLFLFMFSTKRIPGLLIYAFLYELILYWQFIYALFTVKNKSWVTRQK